MIQNNNQDSNNLHIENVNEVIEILENDIENIKSKETKAHFYSEYIASFTLVGLIESLVMVFILYSLYYHILCLALSKSVKKACFGVVWCSFMRCIAYTIRFIALYFPELYGLKETKVEIRIIQLLYVICCSLALISGYFGFLYYQLLNLHLKHRMMLENFNLGNANLNELVRKYYR